jgi:hypothetical protein
MATPSASASSPGCCSSKCLTRWKKSWNSPATSYTSPIPEPMRWRNWAADPEGITGDALLDFVNTELFTTLKNLPGDPAQPAWLRGARRV